MTETDGMENKLIITQKENQIFSFLYQNHDVVEITVEEAEQNILGNIYLGKVKNIIKNINAAFVEIEDGMICYLALEECSNPIFTKPKQHSGIIVGDELLVQVSREGVKTKAPTVTSNLNFIGKYSVLTHGNDNIGVSGKITDKKERERLRTIVSPFRTQDYGFIVRTNAAAVSEDLLVQELLVLEANYKKIREEGIHKLRFSKVFQGIPGYLCDIRDGYAGEFDEILTDDKTLYEEILNYMQTCEPSHLKKVRIYEDCVLPLSFCYGLEDKINKALVKKVWLKSGGYLIIEPTEALTVIDVNTGKAVNGKKNVQNTFYKINLEAAEEIAKQIRLRNLSGIILADFIDMEDKEHQKGVMNLLEERFLKDPVKTVLVDMTALNLVEITRKKVRKPLHEQVRADGSQSVETSRKLKNK